MAGRGRLGSFLAGRHRAVPRGARRAVAALAVGLAVATFGPALARLAGGAPDGWDRFATAAARPFCHQRPERSLVVAGRPLPLCARCTGMWLGLTLGTAAGVLWTSRRRHRVGLGLAALGLAASVAEWLREGAQHVSWPLARLGLGLLLCAALCVAVAGDVLALVAGGRAARRPPA